MHMPNHSPLSFIRRLTAGLAIGQILREEYRYEVHGPFVAVAPAQLARSLPRRLTDRLSASFKSLAYAIHPHRKAENARHPSG